MYLGCRRHATKTSSGYPPPLWNYLKMGKCAKSCQWAKCAKSSHWAMEKGLSKWRSVHPCMPPVKPLGAMGCPPWRCHWLRVTWTRQGKGGAVILESCRKITWLVSAWWDSKIWWCLPTGVRAIMKRKQRPLSLHKPSLNSLNTEVIS